LTSGLAGGGPVHHGREQQRVKLIGHLEHLFGQA